MLLCSRNASTIFLPKKWEIERKSQIDINATFRGSSINKRSYRIWR